MAVLAIAAKDLRLLLRDARSVVILLALPIFFIGILGISLGDRFGKKDEIRVSVVVLDQGVPRFFDRAAMTREGLSWLAVTPIGATQGLAGAAMAMVNHDRWYPHATWSERLLRDLEATAGIRVELIASPEEAKELVDAGRRAAVLVLGPSFSKRLSRCSFLASGWRDFFSRSAGLHADPVSLAGLACFDESQEALPMYLLEGVNPFFRDGVNLEALDVTMLRDPTQATSAAIVDQVAQGSLLRVIMPWMIGRAFDKLGDPQFLRLLGREEQLPQSVSLFLTSPLVPPQQKQQLSSGLQNALQNLFPRYNLTAKTWAALTKERENFAAGPEREVFQDPGLLHRGGARYQLLVPAYLVMFSFFLVLTVGWLFVAERRQGTMTRLLAAPRTHAEILLGKFLPCMALSIFQGVFLLAAGHLLFGMALGARPGWLLAVVGSTSLAAMGLAMLVASLARTEAQVAVYGTLVVLMLAGLSGALMGDRSMMPELMQQFSRITPHAWALDAYLQLLTVPEPNLAAVWTACGVLCGFGAVFLASAWALMRLER